MPELKAIITLVFRITFVVLIAVLMILWIVLSVQSVDDIRELDAQAKKLSQTDRNKYYVKRDFDRVKGMTIFNTLLEEAIALSAILGVLLSHRYILQTSITMLTIIWFLAHYRISDLAWYGSPVMIASHVIHFIVVCIGLSFVQFIGDSCSLRDKSTKVLDSTDVTTKGA